MALADKSAVKAYLETFTSADQIADLCGRNHIVGRKGRCRECALANLLQVEFPGTFFSIHRNLVLARNGEGPQWCFETPAVARTFAYQFDIGRYPELFDNTPAREACSPASIVEKYR